MRNNESDNGDKKPQQLEINREVPRPRTWNGDDYLYDLDKPNQPRRGRGKGITSEKWIQKIFDTKTAKEGGVARRKLSSIDKFASRAWVFDEATKRGFSVIQVREQWVFIDPGFHIVQPTALAA
jgi:hypothetical protein